MTSDRSTPPPPAAELLSNSYSAAGYLGEGFPGAGLNAEQVIESRTRHGANLLSPPKRDPWWRLLLEKFDDPVIRILILAAGLQILIGSIHGEYLEGIAILCAVFLATGIGFINEYRAGREFDLLNRVSDHVPVKTVRSGAILPIPRSDLVVGDLFQLEAGEEVPADAKVILGRDLAVDESRLTGESVPVVKSELPQSDHEGTYAPDLACQGTIVAQGSGWLVVQQVGDRTEFGQTARASGMDKDQDTPLNKQLELLSRWIGVLGLGTALLVFLGLVARSVVQENLVLAPGEWGVVAVSFAALGMALIKIWLPILCDGVELSSGRDPRPAWLETEGVVPWLVFLGLGLLIAVLGFGALSFSGLVEGSPDKWLTAAEWKILLDSFLVAVVVIVVAVPEGLAMSVTLSLAYSMRRMMKENCLVRRMHACETMGALTVICTDKTGTLTMNRMAVVAAKNAANANLMENIPTDPVLAEAIAVNSTAQLTEEGGSTKTLGNPTEGALLQWLASRSISYLGIRAASEVVFQKPFHSDTKWMATSIRARGGEVRVHFKGAPEVILAACRFRQEAEAAQGDVVALPPLTEEGRKRIQEELSQAQKAGHRTIALAWHPELIEEDLAKGLPPTLIWLGWFAISDPIRKEVAPAIDICRKAGIRVTMVTGDTAATAQTIARQAGLAAEGAQTTGPDFAALNDDSASDLAARLSVVSRARPMDKFRLVKLLQSRNEVVAVTGDGTNDGPALNQAHVGVAMGKSGSAVAREASDIILLDDSFASIVTAIKWGRSLYANIQRFLVFQLTINVAALGLAVIGPFIGVSLPLTVMQMLWVNLIMDTFAALALATEPPRDEVMNQPPRHPDAFILTPAMLRSILTTGLVFLAAMIGILLWARMPLADDLPVDANEVMRRQTWVFTAFVLLQFWNLFNVRVFGTGRSLGNGLGANLSFLLIALFILAGQILMVQLGGSVFRTVPLAIWEWGVLLSATALVLPLGRGIGGR